MLNSKKLKNLKNSKVNHSHMIRSRGYLIFLVVLIGMVIISGCTTLTSSKTSFPVVPEPTEAESFDARELLEQAVKTTETSEKTETFWFSGYIKNSIQKRTTTSMFDGVVMRPEQAYLVNGRIAAQPFQYYSYGDTKYIKRDDIWYRPASNEAVLPFNPFGGFTDWMPWMSDAKKLPDEAILSHPSHVIEVRIDAKAWVERSPSPLFEELKLDALTNETMNHILENTIVKMKLWIGKEDNFIYQYSTWIVMPLPGAGYFDQESFYWIYRYDDPSIKDHIQAPEQVERWVVEFEEKLRAGELEGEIEQ